MLPNLRPVHIRTPMNRIPVIASTLAVVAIGAAAYEFTAARRGHTIIAELRRDRDRLEGQLRDAQKQSSDAEQRIALINQQNATLKQDFDRLFSKSSSPPPSTAVVDKTGAPAPQVGFVRGRTFGTPFRGTPGPALDTTYHILYRQLNFSPNQIAQFKAASTEAANRFEELDRQARDRQMRPTDPAMQPLYLQADAQLKAKLTEHFGADALPVIQHFADTLFLREPMLQLASELFYTPTPLSEVQANELVEIMWKNMRDPFGNTNPVFGDASAMKTEAKTVLSPAQLAVWNQFIDYHSGSSFASLRSPLRIRR